MESHAKYFLVGSFVLIGIFCIAVALIWISGMGSGKDYTNYSVYFKKQTLDGLQKDSAVTMKGITVGKVSNYHISDRSIEEVKVTLRLEKDTPVKTDTEAILKRNILTGLAWIDLIGSTQESARLINITKGEEYPVIPEGKSELDIIADSIPGLLEQINTAINRVNAMLSDNNLNAISSILNNVKTATSVLADNKQRLDMTVSNIEKATGEIAQLSGSFKGFADSNDRRIEKLTAELNSTLGQLKATLLNLDKQGKEISSSVQTASRVFSQEITTMSQGITDASNALAKTVESFEDPQSIIAGPREKALGPGEKIAK